MAIHETMESISWLTKIAKTQLQKGICIVGCVRIGTAINIKNQVLYGKIDPIIKATKSGFLKNYQLLFSFFVMKPVLSVLAILCRLGL